MFKALSEAAFLIAGVLIGAAIADALDPAGTQARREAKAELTDDNLAATLNEWSTSK